VAYNRIRAAVDTHKLIFDRAQWEIAADLGVAPSQLSHWTTGRRIPSPARRQQMAEYFGLGVVDEDFLVDVFGRAKEMV
jgi:transcriptional regulator with XRE-family HTH domain